MSVKEGNTMTTTMTTDRLFSPSAPATITFLPFSRSHIEREWGIAKNYIANIGPVLGVEVAVYVRTDHACDSNCYEANTGGGINLTVHFWDEKQNRVLARSLTLFYANIERYAHDKMGYGEAKKHLAEWLEDQVEAAVEFSADIVAEARAMVVSAADVEALRPRAIQSLMAIAYGILNGREIIKGDTVEVYKGRKVPVGTKGVVKWIGSNHYGTSVGILIPGKDGLVFTNIGNCQRVAVSDAEVIAKAKELYTADGYDKVFGAPRG